MNNPRIILADEPSGNLDSENTEAIYKIFAILIKT
jgi:lipoprotein-releasing system ATP-binding protein